MNTTAITIIYQVVLRQPKSQPLHIVVELKRENKRFQLGYCSTKPSSEPSEGILPDTFHLLSNKPSPFLDKDDRDKILTEARASISRRLGTHLRGKKREAPKAIGSIELGLSLVGSRVEVRYRYGGEKIAEWTATDGLRFFEDVHPIFRKDREFIAKVAAEVTQGSGGIFAGSTEGATL